MRVFFVSLCVIGSVYAADYNLELPMDTQAQLGRIMYALATQSQEELMVQSQALVPIVSMVMGDSPLRVISFICGQSEWKSYREAVITDPFKLGLFQKIFATQIANETNAEDFSERLQTVLDRLSISSSLVDAFVEEGKWGEFAVALLQNSQTNLGENQ